MMNFMSLLWLTGCSTSSLLHKNEFTIKYYENGKSINVVIENDDTITRLVTNLVQGTDNSFKMMVTKSTIENAKLKTCTEITFAKEMNITMKNGNIISFTKVLILFKNDEEARKSSSVVFYCGTRDYLSPPYINSEGGAIANEIRRLCVSAIQNK